MQPYLNLLQNTLNSELLRLVATGAVVALCVAFSWLWSKLMNRGDAQQSADTKRARLVWSKNLIWTIGTLCVIGIWGSKIAGFALSLAAVTGAILIVSKELLVCALGYLLIAVSRPYRVGNFIELGGYSGRVIDIDVFSTTLVETGSAKQLTGKTVAFPNSLLISSGVRNLSATGEYMIDLYRFVLPFDCDIIKAERCALEAAEQATSEWRNLADAHFQRIEAAAFIDLPSSRPKVLWEPLDYRSHGLTIRYSCPIEARVATEQEIFRLFWSRFTSSSAQNTPSLPTDDLANNDAEH
jgi:small-conductance mechanosensitive channel